MNCDRCGCEIVPGEETHATASEQVGAAHHGGAQTRTVSLTLCPACARRRAEMPAFVLKALGVLLIGMGLLGLLGWLTR